MSKLVDLNEFRKKKEEQAEKEMAGDLYRLLSELMLDDEPVIISMVDSDGNETRGRYGEDESVQAYQVKVFDANDKQIAEYIYDSIGTATEFQVGMQKKGYTTFMQVLLV